MVKKLIVFTIIVGSIYAKSSFAAAQSGQNICSTLIGVKSEFKVPKTFSDYESLISGDNQLLINELNDFLNYTQFYFDFDHVPTVSLVVDNVASHLSEEFIAEKVKYALNKGFFIIYDADSEAAPLIASIAGLQSLGVSAGQPREGLPQVAIVRNQNVRLALYAKSKAVAVIRESPLGMALIVDNSADFFISEDKTREFMNNMKMEPELKLNLGIRFQLLDKYSIPSRKAVKAEWKPIKKHLLGLSQHDMKMDLEAAYRHAYDMSRVATSIDENATKNGYGAVVFGSGRYPQKYTQPVYQIVRAIADRNIGITTGGSGGVMEIANQAAWDAGSESIGISLGGKLFSEKETKTSIQTQSYSVLSYEQRIPLLLRNKKIVIVAPGGQGTMKELSALLALENSEPSQRLVVFIGKDYYGSLFPYLKASLPAQLRDNYFLIDTAEEMNALLDQYLNKIWSKEEIAQIGQIQPAVARNENTQFILPEPKQRSKPKKAAAKKKAARGKEDKPSEEDDSGVWW